ncbi:hypothetical protein DIPPA_63547 [Diplonema papillatum]|nr:hypothetical protein DIPPA_63547 [Diplonema papillatum]
MVLVAAVEVCCEEAWGRDTISRERDAELTLVQHVAQPGGFLGFGRGELTRYTSQVGSLVRSADQRVDDSHSLAKSQLHEPTQETGDAVYAAPPPTPLHQLTVDSCRFPFPSLSSALVVKDMLLHGGTLSTVESAPPQDPLLPKVLFIECNFAAYPSTTQSLVSPRSPLKRHQQQKLRAELAREEHRRKVRACAAAVKQAKYQRSSKSVPSFLSDGQLFRDSDGRLVFANPRLVHSSITTAGILTLAAAELVLTLSCKTVGHNCDFKSLSEQKEEKKKLRLKRRQTTEGSDLDEEDYIQLARASSASCVSPHSVLARRPNKQLLLLKQRGDLVMASLKRSDDESAHLVRRVASTRGRRSPESTVDFGAMQGHVLPWQSQVGSWMAAAERVFRTHSVSQQHPRSCQHSLQSNWFSVSRDTAHLHQSIAAGKANNLTEAMSVASKSSSPSEILMRKSHAKLKRLEHTYEQATATETKRRLGGSHTNIFETPSDPMSFLRRLRSKPATCTTSGPSTMLSSPYPEAATTSSQHRLPVHDSSLLSLQGPVAENTVPPTCLSTGQSADKVLDSVCELSSLECTRDACREVVHTGSHRVDNSTATVPVGGKSRREFVSVGNANNHFPPSRDTRRLAKKGSRLLGTISCAAPRKLKDPGTSPLHPAPLPPFFRPETPRCKATSVRALPPAKPARCCCDEKTANGSNQWAATEAANNPCCPRPVSAEVSCEQQPQLVYWDRYNAYADRVKKCRVMQKSTVVAAAQKSSLSDEYLRKRLLFRRPTHAAAELS